MVPAESMLNLESKPLFLTKSLKTPSAAGLLQMLPKHTKSTEKGLVSVFVAVDGVVDEAIDALIRDPNGKEEVGLLGIGGKVWFLRDGYWFGGRRTRNGGFREMEWEEWQHCKFGGVNNLLCATLILPGCAVSLWL